MFDFHLHLARLPEPERLAVTLYQQGYRFIAVACEPWEWKSINDLKSTHVNDAAFQFQVAFGIHPIIASKATPILFQELQKYLEQDPTAQVGEAGLDKRYEGYEPGGIQEQVFLEQARLSLELNRDFQIHCVGDYGRTISLLKKAGYRKDSTSRPIFHRFGGDAGIVRNALSLNALFSLHADSFRKKSTATAIAQVPEEFIRFETDADETFAQNLALTTADDCCSKIIERLNAVQNLLQCK